VRILLVEDDVALSEAIVSGLRENSFDVVHAPDYDEGASRAAMGTFDVIVLDVMLPRGSGFDLCREIRRRGIAIPILMLTARDTVDDRVTGLEVGADDYLTKPFAFRELTARVRALSRRRPALMPSLVTVGNLSIDLNTRRVLRGSQRIELTAKEFSLLEFLALHAGQVLGRAAISAHVWDENHDPFTNVLEVLIKRLRRKIDEGFEPKLLHTVRGAGYRFGDE
jgi:two-component system copper resistance phosphate regulon response regulator CusR